MASGLIVRRGKLIFLNSGSEAVHLTCRTARAVTGRGKSVKMAAGYDDWFDGVAFGNAGSPEALMASNVRRRSGNTLLLRWAKRPNSVTPDRMQTKAHQNFVHDDKRAATAGKPDHMFTCSRYPGFAITHPAFAIIGSRTTAATSSHSEQ